MFCQWSDSGGGFTYVLNPPGLSQGPGVLSGEQDVCPQPGCDSGADSVPEREPGSAETQQRIHHPPHAALPGNTLRLNGCFWSGCVCKI